ncbi:carbamate kinase [Clostridium tagluense]|uniref:carbamate kinase n=1 Tax=Clostridium tagluense TaxID=360422 RepID=UPI001CF3FD10|nr:carbamate kinase [Clostridium tagluense]MCB2297491.1 carbamate kinase [Clostridium tagluense]MCB2312451.1 carbamate kinase [Clostridium tagluense]MCB2317126.1 carbamate kinase [Clostridium tagluense]MCB2321990.1 carbamate kinase [Clostridium tagluense]MCB2326999.1 carbamate kinase [Clostridium tagluense]
MKKKIVIALGGNALGNNLEEQMVAVKSTAIAIVDLIEAGNEVVISHGNGPQVGMINIAMSELHKNNPKYSLCPMSVCVAMSQAYIGYDLQNALREELHSRNINKSVSTIITQVEVNPKDKAFENPTKPIGSFMTKEEADISVKSGKVVIEDAGRGYREVVASPKPVGIIEIETIKSLVEMGQVVIACGGGGIPVIKEGNHLKGVNAVIDKDFASCTLAKELHADCLIILTAVEKVAINFGKPNEKWLHNITTSEIKQYAREGHFAPGSMLPKVEAAIDFASSKDGRYSLITLLEKAKDGIAGKTGTIIK